MSPSPRPRKKTRVKVEKMPAPLEESIVSKRRKMDPCSDKKIKIQNWLNEIQKKDPQQIEYPDFLIPSDEDFEEGDELEIDIEGLDVSFIRNNRYSINYCI